MSVPSKRRTREHVIADLSINHAEKQVLLAGYVADRVMADYGYDLIIRTFDDSGHVERSCFFAQLKASDTLDYNKDRSFVSVRLDPRDRAMWQDESLPVVLIAYDPLQDVAFYVHFQALANLSSLTVRIPTTQRFNADAVKEMRRIKNETRKATRNADIPRYNL